MTVLTLIEHYRPTFRYGGPITSVYNIVESLGARMNFKVITRDHEYGERGRFATVRSDEWMPHGKASVYYASRKSLFPWQLARLMARTDYDCLYLNSVFLPHLALVPTLLNHFHRLPKRPLIIAPRGCFAPGSMAVRRPKKDVFLALSRLTGVHDDVIWHVGSETEARDTRSFYGPDARIVVAPDLPSVAGEIADAPPTPEKKSGELKIVFLSRVAYLKNLDGALAVLQRVKENVEFDIVGPIYEPDYWEKCQRMIAALPPNVKVNYRGPAMPHEVAATFAKSHLFYLPTLGESFGQVIIESLLNGCSVLISDRTPWRGLDGAGVGLDAALDRPEDFLSFISRMSAMDQAEFNRMSAAARAYGQAWIARSGALEKTEALFRDAVK